MKMTLAEARKKFIGKTFRLKKDVPLSWKYDWGSGEPWGYIPAGCEGVLTQIIENSFYEKWEFVNETGFEMKPVGKPHKYFKWRIEIPGVDKMWYLTSEIEPVN